MAKAKKKPVVNGKAPVKTSPMVKLKAPVKTSTQSSPEKKKNIFCVLCSDTYPKNVGFNTYHF